MRAMAVLLLASVAVATRSSAQLLTTPPQGIILPNYDLVRVGQWEAIESGAVMARTSGPLANVYNPAGLASSEKTVINGSSTGYQYTRLNLEGIGNNASAGRLANLGGFLGVALAEPVIKSDKWRLGFSVFSPIGWEPGTLSGAEQGVLDGQDVLLEYRTQVRLRADVPSIAAGVKLSKKLRLGLAFQVPVVSVRQQQATSSLAFDGLTAGSITRAFAADGSVWLVRATGGLQWDASDKLSFGLMAELPTARLWGSSFYSDERTAATGSGFVTAHFRDPNARLDYKLPFLLGGGVALRLGKVEMEGDVRWYSSVSQFDIYESDSIGVAVVAENPTVVAPVSLAPVMLNFRSVVNFSIGAHFPLSERWKVHVGFNSDQSPMPNTGELFREVDLIGATAGVSFTVSHLSGSVGIGLQKGKSPVTPVAIASYVRDTRLEVTTFQLLYSLTYAF